jgi:hypothetical protein
MTLYSLYCCALAKPALNIANRISLKLSFLRQNSKVWVGTEPLRKLAIEMDVV